MTIFSFSRALILAAALAAPAALAQTAAPTLAPAQPAVRIPTDAEAELGRQLVVSSGLSASFAGAVAGLMDQLGRTLTRTRPEMIKELQSVMVANEADFLKEADSLTAAAGKITASQLTEKEMRDALAFFNSPAGKKYVAAQPLILSSVELASQSWRTHLSQVITDKVRAEMKKKGFEF